MANYITNKELYNELIFCRDASITHTDKLINMFTIISTKYANGLNFKRNTDRNDVIQGGIIDAFTYWHNWDPSKSSNAFAYITQIIKNGQLKTLKKIYPSKVIFISLTNIHSL